MAPVVAWLAAVIGSYVIAQAIVGAVISFAISTAVGYFMKKPGSGAASFDSSLNVTVSDPATDRWFLYGETQYGGRLVFARVSDDSKYLHLVVVYACHEIDSFRSLSIDGTELTLNEAGAATGAYAGYVWAKMHLGAWDQTVDTDLKAAFPTEWTDDHRLRGFAYIYWKFKWNPDLFRDRPNTLALIRGRKVYDQRDEDQDMADPSTWLWSRNAILNAQDYLRGIPMKKADGTLVRWFGVNADDGDIALSEMAAEATICDESVPLKAGGVQARYTLDGIVSTDNEPGDVLTSMLTACAGRRIDAGGRLSLLAGVARTPEVFLDIGDVVGPIRSQPNRSMEQLFNGIKGKYRGPETQYDIGDAPPFQDTALVVQDGRESWTDYTMEFTDNAEACQRLQKIYISENRRQVHVEVPMTLSALRLRAGTWFGFSWPGRGWTGKTFYCDKLTGQHIQDEDGQSYLGLTISMQEIDSHIYDWDKDDATIVNPSPVSNLPRPQAAEPLAVAGEIIEYRDRAKVRLSATPRESGIVTGYQFAFKQQSAPSWTQLPDIAVPETTTYLDVGAYSIRGRGTLAPYGKPSDWVVADFIVGVPPLTPRVTGLELAGGGVNSEFTGRDATLIWRQGRDGGGDINNPLGADLDQQPPHFAGYRIEVRTLADVDWPNGRLLRETTLFDARFTYSFDMNYHDSTAIGLRGAQRRFRVSVTQLGRYGAGLEYSLPQSIEIFNAAPLVPTDLNIRALVSDLRITYTAPSDPDFVGLIVWASLTDGFDPAEVDPLFIGKDTLVVLDLTADETWYVRIAAYDAFIGTYDPGDVDLLNVSAQVSVTTQSVLIAADIPRFSFLGLDIRPNATGDGVEWDSGQATVKTNGGAASYTIASGDASWTSGEVFVWYEAGLTVLSDGTDINDALAATKVLLATYRGGTDITRGDGGPLVDGNRLVVGSLAAGALAADTAYIQHGAQIGSAVIGDASIVALSADKLVADTAIIERLYVGEDELVEINGSSGAQRLIFYEEV